MDIRIDRATALSRHAKLADEFEGILRASKSASRDLEPEKFRFKYWVIEAIQSDSFAGLLNGKASARQDKWDALTAVQKAADRVRRSEVYLTITAGKFKRDFKLPRPFPPEVKQTYLDWELKLEAMNKAPRGEPNPRRDGAVL